MTNTTWPLSSLLSPVPAAAAPTAAPDLASVDTQAIVTCGSGRQVVHCADYLPAAAEEQAATRLGLSAMAMGICRSEAIQIAGEVRVRIEQGRPVCNLTIGDFDPNEFPIPRVLEAAIFRAYENRETNYPPSDGLLPVKRAVATVYERELGLRYPDSCIVITSGARPAIYVTYRAVLDRGERVIFPVPSWNNEHYCHLAEATAVPFATRAADRFLPTAGAIAKVLAGARLLVLNSPLNPSGALFSAEGLRAICELVVEENRRRQRLGQRTLYLLYDQIYWMLAFPGARHHSPPELCPEVAAYTILVDGISKALSATGLRVGWVVAPPYVAAKLRDILAHVGAAAPRPEQVAVGEVLADSQALSSYRAEMLGQVQLRLQLLYEGFVRMREAGLVTDVIRPEGSLYLAVRFPLGRLRRSQPEAGSAALTEDRQIYRYLLEEAGMAVVPFSAFGLTGQREEASDRGPGPVDAGREAGSDERSTGWMRLSVGSVSVASIKALLPRAESALRALRP